MNRDEQNIALILFLIRGMADGCIATGRSLDYLDGLLSHPDLPAFIIDELRKHHAL